MYKLTYFVKVRKQNLHYFNVYNRIIIIIRQLVIIFEYSVHI